MTDHSSNTDYPNLHLHLDGSLRLDTLRELALRFGVKLPESLFFFQGMGLQRALECFATTLAVLQQPEEVKRVASEICEDAQKDQVTTLEIRFAPQLHKGASIETIVEAALEGIQGRAGLILCGLYGEEPSMLESLVALGQKYLGVVGIDLAGGPLPQHQWGLKDYAKAFSKARDLGLGRTVHAGEGRPPCEIKEAIELLHVQRISTISLYWPYFLCKYLKL